MLIMAALLCCDSADLRLQDTGAPMATGWSPLPRRIKGWGGAERGGGRVSGAGREKIETSALRFCASAPTTFSFTSDPSQLFKPIQSRNSITVIAVKIRLLLIAFYSINRPA